MNNNKICITKLDSKKNYIRNRYDNNNNAQNIKITNEYETLLSNNNKSLNNSNDILYLEKDNIKIDNYNDKTVVNLFDFSMLDQYDPLLLQGYNTYTNNKLEFEIINKKKTLKEELVLRILYKGEENSPSSIKIDLSSENDVFFYYLLEITPYNYKALKEINYLNCSFSNLLPFLKKLFFSCININNTANSYISSAHESYNHENSINTAPIIIENKLNNKTIAESYKLVLNVDDNNPNIILFKIIKVLKHKEIDIVIFDMQIIDNKLLKKVVSYRMNYYNSLIDIIKDRILSIEELVNEKNPELYNIIKKEPSKLTDEYIKSITISNFYKYNKNIYKKTN